MTNPPARLTSEFLSRIEKTGMTDAAIAAALGISRQYYSEVKAGRVAPSIRFLAAAVNAGLADDFASVAEPVEPLAA